MKYAFFFSVAASLTLSACGSSGDSGGDGAPGVNTGKTQIQCQTPAPTKASDVAAWAFYMTKACGKSESEILKIVDSRR